MERDVEYYLKNGFDFAKGIIEEFFGKTSIFLDVSEKNFKDGADVIKRVNKNFREENLRAYMKEDDLKIRVNKKILEMESQSYSIPLKDFYFTWSACITSYFYPYAYFLESTNYGKNLREELSKVYLVGKIEKEFEREVENVRRWFSGIGFWAEVKVGEYLPFFNLFSEKIRVVKEDERILEYLDESNGFKLCDMLERKAKGSSLEEYKKKSIIAEAIKYVDKLEDNFSFGLEKLMIKIGRNEMNIDEIFSSGIKIFIAEPQVKEIYESFTELTKNIITRNWSIVKRNMKELCNNLEKIGEVELSEEGLELVSLIEKEFEEAKGLESGKMYVEDLLKDPSTQPIYIGLREWLIDVENFYKKFGERKVKEI